MSEKPDGQELLMFILGLLSDEKEKSIISALQKYPDDEEAISQLIKKAIGRDK